MVLHLEKKAIRALGIAESFKQREATSTVAGVVMRSDLVVDGFGLARLTVSGSDAVTTLSEVYSKLERNDVNSILLSGSILSLYNIVDVDKLHSDLKIPVVAITFRKSRSDLERNIRAKFPESVASQKIKLVRKLGTPQKIQLKTGYPVFVRTAGINSETTRRLLDRFTLQGAIPEPIRVAKLLAKVASAWHTGR